MKRMSGLTGGFFGCAILTRDQKNLLLSMSFLFIATGLSIIFINTFLYWAVMQADGTSARAMNTVLRYNLFFFASTCVFSVVAGLLSRYLPGARMSVGLVCYASLYVLLLVFGEDVPRYEWLLGILAGLGASFYHISYNAAIIGFTGERGRGYYMCMQNVITALAGILAPFLTGIVLSVVGGLRGYQSIFTASLLLLVASEVVSTRLPHIAKSKQSNFFLKLLTKIFTNKALVAASIAEAIRGIRDGVMIFLPITLLMVMGAPVAVVGLYILVCTLLQAVSSRLVRRTLYFSNSLRFLGIAVIAAIAAPLFFIWQISAVSVFAYGVITSITYGFFLLPSVLYYHQAVGSLSDIPKRPADGMAVRDFCLNLGRTAGVAILLMIPKEMIWLAYAMVGLGLSQLLVMFFYSFASKYSLQGTQQFSAEQETLGCEHGSQSPM